MGRKRISEYAAKKILHKNLGWNYSGISIHPSIKKQIDNLSPDSAYVVKVDQGIKKRFKQGLVSLDTPIHNIEEVLTRFQEKGYSQFIIEPYIPHDSASERYIALERIREGIKVYCSVKGGVDIESHTKDLQTFIISSEQYIEKTASILSCSKDFIKKLLAIFDDNYFSFLEINPFIIDKNKIHLLDVACEVDSAAEFFVDNAWSENDFVDEFNKTKGAEEKKIEELAAKSQASFTFKPLNKDGAVFVLLSGGGASIVIADEVYNQGIHKELANYGEYSGNPNAEETYLYTSSLLQFLLQSKAKKKVLIIGGGVANFTDIRTTFKGIIRALSEVAQKLREQEAKVFVRRGGPYQKEGLAMMSEFLKKENLYGDVNGPEMVLTDIVHKAIDYLNA